MRRMLLDFPRQLGHLLPLCITSCRIELTKIAESLFTLLDLQNVLVTNHHVTAEYSHSLGLTAKSRQVERDASTEPTSLRKKNLEAVIRDGRGWKFSDRHITVP